MKALEDFDLLINEFESEVENLKSIKEAYSKLAQLVDSLNFESALEIELEADCILVIAASYESTN